MECWRVGVLEEGDRTRTPYSNTPLLHCSPLPCQLVLNSPERQAIYHVRFREPAFARDTDPEP